jgi:hypothetical protein
VQLQKIIEALLTARQVAEAKHSAYTGRLNDDRLANMTLEGMASLLREFGDPAATVTPNERAKVAALFFLISCAIKIRSKSTKQHLKE